MLPTAMANFVAVAIFLAILGISLPPLPSPLQTMTHCVLSAFYVCAAAALCVVAITLLLLFIYLLFLLSSRLFLLLCTLRVRSLFVVIVIFVSIFYIHLFYCTFQLLVSLDIVAVVFVILLRVKAFWRFFFEIAFTCSICSNAFPLKNTTHGGVLEKCLL